MKNYATLILFFLFQIAFSQYVWTNAKVDLVNGETLNGQAKITIHKSASMFNLRLITKKDKLVFREKKGDKKRKFLAEDIKKVEFFFTDYSTFGSGIYESVKIDEQKPNYFFFQILEEGEFAKLYKRKTESTTPSGYGNVVSSSEEYWIWKKGEPKMFDLINIAIRSKSFKNRLLEIFGDCDLTNSKIEEKQYDKNRESLGKLVKDYNSCRSN